MDNITGGTTAVQAQAFEGVQPSASVHRSAGEGLHESRDTFEVQWTQKEQSSTVVHRLLCRDSNHKSLAKVLNIYRVQYFVIIEYTGLITRKRCQSLQRQRYDAQDTTSEQPVVLHEVCRVPLRIARSLGLHLRVFHKCLGTIRARGVVHALVAPCLLLAVQGIVDVAPIG